MNRIFSLVTVLLCAVLCVSCNTVSTLYDDDTAPGPGQIKVYCTDSESEGLHWENRDLTTDTVEAQVQQVFGFLGENTDSSTHKKALPQDVRIISYYFGKDGQLVIDFSAEYLNMDKIQEALCRAAVVKTFCQIKNVDSVEFYIEGQPLKVGDFSMGLMTDNDFVYSTGKDSGIKENYKATVFLAEKDGKMLRETVMDIVLDGTASIEKTVLQNYIKIAEESSEDNPSVNKDTVINRISAYDGICYVDLSEDFLSKPYKISDEVAVYGVVNTLCELPGITKVKITIDGSEKKNFGKVSIDDFLSLRPELISQ